MKGQKYLHNYPKGTLALPFQISLGIFLWKVLYSREVFFLASGDVQHRLEARFSKAPQYVRSKVKPKFCESLQHNQKPSFEIATRGQIPEYHNGTFHESGPRLPWAVILYFTNLDKFISNCRGVSYDAKSQVIPMIPATSLGGNTLRTMLCLKVL